MDGHVFCCLSMTIWYCLEFSQSQTNVTTIVHVLRSYAFPLDLAMVNICVVTQRRRCGTYARNALWRGVGFSFPRSGGADSRTVRMTCARSSTHGTPLLVGCLGPSPQQDVRCCHFILLALVVGFFRCAVTFSQCKL